MEVIKSDTCEGIFFCCYSRLSKVTLNGRKRKQRSNKTKYTEQA